MNASPVILLSFGRTDPLNLTRQARRLLSHLDCPILEASGDWPHGYHLEVMRSADVVYCGSGQTMLEALAFGKLTYVISNDDPLEFAPAFTAPTHYDHSLKPVHWTVRGQLAAMCAEIRNRTTKESYI